MKKKIDYRIALIVILLIILIILCYLYFKPASVNTISNISTTSNTNTTTYEEQAQTKTIINSISSSGEVTSSLEESIELHATYYFSEIYYEENQIIEEGANILKYTNGTYLTAPYSCVITGINIPDSGSQCTNSHYIKIQSTDLLTMSLSIGEDELDSVYVGQEAQIQINVYEDVTYTGYVTKISSSAKYSSNGSSFTITVEFENDGNILIGMSASCQVILEKAENVIAVPVNAVTTSKDISYVTIVENGTTRQVEVETGISNDAYIEIKSGLNGTETIQITEETSSSSGTSGASSSSSNSSRQIQRGSGNFGM